MSRTRAKTGTPKALLRTVAVLACVPAFAGFLSCGGAKERPVSDAEIARARALLVPFKQELQAALGEGLAGGIESAIDVCRVKAPEIAASLSTGGVAVGRTSHRLRNRGNAPEAWVAPLLAAYDRGGEEAAPRAVRLSDGYVGYVEPIYVKPMCLACHGDDIDPSVAERLDAEYPGDEARGFAEGDFRGVFWVKLPPSR